MAAVATYPSGTNTFVPNSEASGKLVVDFSRNPKSFALPKYVQYVKTQKNVGLYSEMTVEMAGRTSTDGIEFSWPDGQEAPSGIGNEESFVWKSFQTQRHAIPYRIGQLAAEQAEWDLLAQFARIAAQRAMTLRTAKTATLLTTSGNYAAANTSAVASITGNSGVWNLSTVGRMDIKRSLDYAAEIIVLNTLGAVSPSDLILVLNPTDARKIAVCQEIRDHIKQSGQAVKTITGNVGPLDPNFGLPATIYDYPVVVEKTVRVTNKKGATKATSFVWPSASAALVSRPGGLEGVEGAPSFSSATLFFKEEMTTETKHDTDNRLHKGRIVDDYVVTATALNAGFLFTSATS